MEGDWFGSGDSEGAADKLMARNPDVLVQFLERREQVDKALGNVERRRLGQPTTPMLLLNPLRFLCPFKDCQLRHSLNQLSNVGYMCNGKGAHLRSGKHEHDAGAKLLADRLAHAIDPNHKRVTELQLDALFGPLELTNEWLMDPEHGGEDRDFRPVRHPSELDPLPDQFDPDFISAYGDMEARNAYRLAHRD